MPGPAIETVATIASTSDELLARAARGDILEEGQWLIADRQTAGRGRAGRNWEDGLGNFMGSTTVASCPGDPPPQTLSLVFALAVHDALTIGTLSPTLKWPNDVLIDGKKVAGILLQKVHDWIIGGIGINIAAPSSLPSSVALADLDIEMTRDDVGERLARATARRLAEWRRQPFAKILDEWMERGPRPGAAVMARIPNASPVQGRYEGLAPDGALRLRLDDGTMRVIHAGEVALIGP